MKKFLAIIVLVLLWSGYAHSDSIKDMIISCSPKKHTVHLSYDSKEWPLDEFYDISIKNNKASYTGSSFYLNYENFILESMSDEEYYFISENNNKKIFARIIIDRIKATATIGQAERWSGAPIDFELIELKNCKLIDNKPKF